MTNCVFEEPHYIQIYTWHFSLCHDKCGAYLPSLLPLIYIHFTVSKFASGTWIIMNGHQTLIIT